MYLRLRTVDFWMIWNKKFFPKVNRARWGCYCVLIIMWWWLYYLLAYRPVSSVGTFDHSREHYIGPRSLLSGGQEQESRGLSSNPEGIGWHVVTPFKITEGSLKVWQLSTHFFQLAVYKKIIYLCGWQINYPTSRKQSALPFLPVARLCLGHFKGFLSWHAALQGPSTLPSCVASGTSMT